ncbi:MAG: 50S ribosome-binding GTPase [Labilithrix sp.]|nr:50S ribosome-binding GTPase [Labilithrix sp.]MBX3225192.1 50S ribosome-binding GTPase [Labilithrix sp.]
MPQRETEEEAKMRKIIADNIRRVEEMLQFLPLHPDTVKDLRAKVGLLRTILLEQRAPAFALVGRRGAGKSSLVNALFGSRVAEVGHVKSQTGQGKWFDYTSERGAMSVLDTRGIQEGSRPAEADSAKDAVASILAPLKRKVPDVILFLVKGTEADSGIDADLAVLERIYAEIEREHRFRPPLVAIATHCDVLEPKAARLHLPGVDAPEDIDEKLARVAEVEHHLETKIKERPKLAAHLVWTRGVSSYMSFRDGGELRGDERWRIDELVGTLFKHLPDAGRGTFVRIARVRGLQEQLATDLTRATAVICTGVAAVPIPIADVFPITAMQMALVAGIAWLSGRPLDKKAAAEFLGALGANVGAAVVLREGFRALMKVVAPGLGSMISGAIAFAGTMAVGAAARQYFLRGGSIEDARRAFADAKAAAEDEGKQQEDEVRRGMNGSPGARPPEDGA